MFELYCNHLMIALTIKWLLQLLLDYVNKFEIITSTIQKKYINQKITFTIQLLRQPIKMIKSTTFCQFIKCLL